MRVLVHKWSAVALYLVSVCGMSFLCAHLSYHVARQAIAHALPYFPQKDPRRLSLMERRQIEVAQAAKPFQRVTWVIPTTPSISAQNLAAQLDIAEKDELRHTQPGPRTARQRTRRRAPPIALSAADEFARSFGVLTVASR